MSTGKRALSPLKVHTIESLRFSSDWIHFRPYDGIGNMSIYVLEETRKDHRGNPKNRFSNVGGWLGFKCCSTALRWSTVECRTYLCLLSFCASFVLFSALELPHDQNESASRLLGLSAKQNASMGFDLKGASHIFDYKTPMRSLMINARNPALYFFVRKRFHNNDNHVLNLSLGLSNLSNFHAVSWNGKEWKFTKSLRFMGADVRKKF